MVLIIKDTHNRMLHSGVNTTLTAMRERFWIIRRRQTVKKIVRRSVRCRKVEGKQFSLPQQPDLPEEHVSDDPPFTHTGVDFAGPLYTSEKGANVALLDGGPQLSRQKQNTSQQNRKRHDKNKNLAAKPKTLRQNQRPHGKTKAILLLL